MKPLSVEVYPVYICSSCNSRHCESMDYINKVGKILCGCGNVMKLDGIETFKITPIYKTPTPKKDSPPSQRAQHTDDESDDTYSLAALKEKTTQETQQKQTELPANEFEQSVSLLMRLGWKKRESEHKTRVLYEQWYQENEQLIGPENFDEFANYLFFNHSN